MIASSLNEGADLFEADRSLLLNSTLDTTSLVFRVIWRNAIIFAHTLPVVAIALWLGITQRQVYKIVKANNIERRGSLYDLAGVIASR